MASTSNNQNSPGPGDNRVYLQVKREVVGDILESHTLQKDTQKVRGCTFLLLMMVRFKLVSDTRDENENSMAVCV